jgi:hypothetical protein
MFYHHQMTKFKSSVNIIYVLIHTAIQYLFNTTYFYYQYQLLFIFFQKLIYHFYHNLATIL